MHVRKYRSVAIILSSGTSMLGTKTTVKGWVKSVRKLKDIIFADINDGSSVDRLSVVIPKKIKPSSLTWGSSVEICGTLSSGPKGQFELMADDINVVGSCVVADGYPFQPRKSYPPDYIRQHLHLRSRTNNFAAVLRVRNAAAMAAHKFFQSNHFINTHTPILTSNDCEGAGELFRVQPESTEVIKSMSSGNQNPEEVFFDSKTFLTVSSQLHLESLAHGLGNVYTLGPVFRAENSKSRLHLAEFYMLEAELAFCRTISQLQNIIEGLIKHIFKSVLNECEQELHFLHGSKSLNFGWVDKEFITLRYDEAVRLLQNNPDVCSNPPALNGQLTKDHEFALVRLSSGIPTFVIDWPKDNKPFYMKGCKHDPTKVDALDLLAPITGEIVGGSLREDNYEILKAKLPSEQLNWYLDLRKFGNIPTGGFGLGFERLLQILCGVQNIKDTIPFPRWPHNCSM